MGNSSPRHALFTRFIIVQGGTSIMMIFHVNLIQTEQVEVDRAVAGEFTLHLQRAVKQKRPAPSLSPFKLPITGTITEKYLLAPSSRSQPSIRLFHCSIEGVQRALHYSHSHSMHLERSGLFGRRYVWPRTHGPVVHMLVRTPGG